MPESTPALFGLVGWHPATESNPSGPLYLRPALLESRSELYVNDLSDLLGLQNLAEIKPEAETLDAFVHRLSLDAVRKLTIGFMAKQELSETVILADAPLLNTPGRAGDTINKTGRFVGIRLSVAALKGVAWSVSALTLQLDAALSDDLPLYMYSDAQAEPVKILTVAAGANRANYPYHVNVEDENALDISFAAVAGQFAYIGYYEDDLGTAHAIRREFTGLSCGCTNDPWAVWNKVISPRAFSVPAQYVDEAREAPAPESVVVESETFGLNLLLYGVCQPASALLWPDRPGKPNNQLLLAEAVQLAIGIRFMEALTTSPNITQLVQREAVQADGLALLYNWQAKLYGGKEHGTENYYPSLLKGVTLDYSGLDSACLPKPADRLTMGSLRR